jgi:uncharacterized protein (DUF4213/DUF364 family)
MEEVYESARKTSYNMGCGPALPIYESKGQTMIFDRTLDLLQRLHGERIKNLKIDRIVIGIFFTGVKLSDGSGGVAYTPRDDLYGVTCCHSMAAERPSSAPLKGIDVSDVLGQPARSALSHLVKLVVMNALSSRFITPDRYRIVYDADALDLIDLGKAGRIGMVGAFIPFLKQLKAVPGIDLALIERKPEVLKADEMRFYVPAEKAHEALSSCDTVIITGATMANRTIDDLLGYTKPGADVIVTGPTASMLPDVLFEHNVRALCGVQVIDPDAALDMLAEGEGALRLFHSRCVRKMNVLRG